MLTPAPPAPAAAPANAAAWLRRESVLPSAALGRDVALTVLLPPGFSAAAAPYPVLYLNDGQDVDRLGLPATLADLGRRQLLRPFVLLAPHAGPERLHEYGVAARADYNGRGSRAAQHTAFIINELRPYAQQHYGIGADPGQAVYAGFSLGGLMAFDAVWAHPEVFARAGAFSGSFWWRSRAVGAGYTPADRIMHAQVRAGQPHPAHQFWLQTGTLDERNDRNENGVIDSLEDCLDLIEALVARGLDPHRALRYVQVEGGHHHPDTWGRLIPDFLCWAFGNDGLVNHLPPPLPVVRVQLDPALAPAVLLPTASAPAPPPAPPLVLPASATPPPPTAPAMPLARPAAADYQPYYERYISLLSADADPLAALRTQPAEVEAALGALTEAQASTPYAADKWTVKQMLLHQIDTERVFSDRALRAARGETQPQPGFDENEYAAQSEAHRRPLPSLLAEYRAVRAATLALFESFDDAQLDRRGTANGAAITPRALLFILPGHERHHLNIFRERYLPVLGSAR